MALPTPPPPTQALRYPVTSVVGLAAILVTLAWWGEWDADPFFLDARALYGQPWRLVLSALPHVDLPHLAFNVLWLWIFGTLLEGTLGRRAVAGQVLLFAA